MLVTGSTRLVSREMRSKMSDNLGPEGYVERVGERGLEYEMSSVVTIN